MFIVSQVADLVLDSFSGKIGISQASPAYSLDIDGTARASSNLLAGAKIGINNTSPSVSLDISATDAIKLPVGTTAQRPSAADGLMRLNTTTNQFEGYQNGNWQGLGGVIDVDQDTYVSTETSSDDDTLFFYTGGSERARISSAGLIGIGTNSPSTSLDIGTTDAIKIPVGTTAQRPTAANGMIRLNTTTNQFEGYNSNWVGLGGVIDIDQDTYVSTEKTSDDDTLFFYTSNSERMRIKSDGNVGIGTNAPAYKLEVKASVTGDWLSRIYNTASSGSAQGLLVRVDDSTAGVTHFGVHNGTSHNFAIKGDGKVGIGTTSPTSLNHVTGKLRKREKMKNNFIGILITYQRSQYQLKHLKYVQC